jgi:hypothetical protein
MYIQSDFCHLFLFQISLLNKNSVYIICLLYTSNMFSVYIYILYYIHIQYILRMVQLIIPTSTFASLRPHCPSLPQSAPPRPKSARPRSLLLVIDLYQFNKDVRIEDWGYRGCDRAGRVCGWGLGLRVWGCGWSCLIGMRVLFKYRFVTANHVSICLVSQCGKWLCNLSWGVLSLPSSTIDHSHQFALSTKSWAYLPVASVSSCLPSH